MSWFKRRPRVKEPPKSLPAHRTSPAAERMFQEIKNKYKIDPPKKIK